MYRSSNLWNKNIWDQKEKIKINLFGFPWLWWFESVCRISKFSAKTTFIFGAKLYSSQRNAPHSITFKAEVPGLTIFEWSFCFLNPPRLKHGVVQATKRVDRGIWGRWLSPHLASCFWQGHALVWRSGLGVCANQRQNRRQVLKFDCN